MIVNDPIFGELEYEYCWSRDVLIHFFGKDIEISLMIDGDEVGSFDEAQYTAYQTLMAKWERLQPDFLEAIADYYKKKREDLGYDIVHNEDYPLVETPEQMLEMITLAGIVVQYGDIYEERDIGILFDCTWDKENGLGLRLLNEKVSVAGYQEEAF
ncbi:DUF6985 domain-containing protein [Metabacillus indicus]|uniref:DUF6985 domain-containing protein n=1 Tax=Metabacillus indicus TaxID=246786 RepID=A0A084H247_METID|nr:DUF2004 domain-containing protein [Metabacillus indicus]KEZ53659.1 hypothetical protein GS18_0201370 [Metabacillus indicus]